MKIALLPLVVDLAGEDATTLPKVVFSRLSAYLLLGVTIPALLARPPRWSWLWGALALYVAVSSVAAVAGAHLTTGVFGAPDRYLGLTALIDGAVLSLAIAVFVRTRRDVLLIARAAAAAGFIVATYGLLQIAGMDPISWRDNALGSTIGNSAAVGGYLAVVFALCVIVLLRFSRELRSVEGYAWAATAALSLFVLLRTGARGPMLALPLIVLAMWLFTPALAARVGEDRRLRYGSVLVLFVAASLLLTSPGAQRVRDLVAGNDTSIRERVAIYEASIKILSEHPLLGVGPDGLITQYLLVRSREVATDPALTPMQSSTHSWLLHAAVGSGLVGAASILLLFAVALRRAIAARTEPVAAVGGAVLTAYLLQGLLNVSHVAIEWAPYVAIGLIGSTAQGSSGPVIPLGRRALERLAIGTSVTALLFGAMGTSDLLANRSIAASNRARTAGATDRAVRAAEAAARDQSGRAEPWNVLGLAHAARADARATTAFMTAAERAPYDSVYALNVAREQLRLPAPDKAQRELALRYAEAAVKVDPNGAHAHGIFANALLVNGRNLEALEHARIALGLQDDTHYLVVAAEAVLALDRRDQAAEYMLSAVRRADATSHPARLAIRVRAAEVLWRADRTREAVALLDETLLAWPNDPAASALRAQILAAAPK